MARTRNPNARLRELLNEANLTQDILARAVNAAGAEIGLTLRYDRTSVAHWLAGSRPAERTVPLVCEVLSRRTRRAVTPQDAGLTTRVPQPTARPSGEPDRRLRELASGLSVHTPYRPAGSLPGPAARSELHERLGRVPREEAAGPLGGAVTFFTRAFLEQGGGFARETLRTYLTEAVAERLRTAREAERRRLSPDASRLTLLLGRMYADDLHHGAAQHCYREAWRLAAEARHLEPAVIALRTLSAQAHQLGQRRIAGTTAGLAADAARKAPPAVQAFTQTQLAVVAAHRGDRADALSALARADRATGDRADEPSAERYGRADFEYQRAETLLALHDGSAAVRAFEDALSARSRDDRRGAAMTRLRLAAALLSQGRVDEALQHERPLSRECAELRTAALTVPSAALRRSLATRTARDRGKRVVQGRREAGAAEER
ncbi:hypothetical protein IAG44_04960 [Streptomyces roseirectus]|uniref:Transcriptional regulator n=1 Tax=Streptomyces roseirectus TaxID=2768066 RepID=A0A7H0I7U9_9ACTN|nr:hypothetical protein [Streptomyces roseirectus]QNP68865.1 hypothetical protein IAG44_04960 [Streptomyces roseirectus]